MQFQEMSVGCSSGIPRSQENLVIEVYGIQWD